jgi:hypothetical protein
VPIAHQHRQEAGAPASSGAQEDHRLQLPAVEGGTCSVPVVEQSHRGQEAVETDRAHVHPGTGVETDRVEVALLGQELAGPERSQEQEVAERQICIN